ncbi:MAG: hypothetical protein A2Y12_07365 [Planctomycetes bacterium GWF2_42_9]|nr:MAG: hypothetical protein A2Y12_07365 [Planctomycetes bacterium GWF2_42_9]HAL44531.1 hypothetical protein [Phycisphaerales bacterium]
MKKALIIIAIVSVISSLASAQLAGYWTFNEGTGTTAADSSGKGKTASFYSANGSNYPTWITGHNGGALQFNANTTGTGNFNKLNVPIIATDALANLTKKSFTVAMWVRRDAGSYGVVEPGLVGTDVYEIDLATDPCDTGANGRDYIYRTDKGTYVDLGTENTAQKTLGSWYHYAVTYDGNDLRKYVNGIVQTTVTTSMDFNAIASDYFMIASNAWDSFFVGALDDVAVWTGSYLKRTEIEKLYNGTATPLTVTQSEPLPPNYFTMETSNAWTSNGWKLLIGPGFSTFSGWPGENITLSTNNTASVWYIKDISLPGWPNAAMKPDGHYALWADGQAWYHFMDLDPTTYYEPSSRDVTKFGMAWIDPSWSGVAANIAKFAVYITPGIGLGIPNNNGYEPYDPNNSWMIKEYFKTYARVAAVNAGNAMLRVKTYSYTVSTNRPALANLTLLGEVLLPLYYGNDYEWQEFKFAFPKPRNSSLRVWTELSIVGGNANTRIYVDEFNPISDQANTSQHTASYLAGDLNKDTIVNYDDIWDLGSAWLDSATTTPLVDPRSGGLLTNGDFSTDGGLLNIGTDARVYTNPSGWTFSGTVANNYGIQKVDNRGEFNFTWLHTPTLPAIVTPLGGTVAAYLTDKTVNDPYGVLSQTTTATAVSGQTYYAMGYVMTNTWYGWKDEATMNISIDGVTKTSVKRVLSRNKWRPIYGTYTATAADAGKTLTISFSYSDIDANSVTVSQGNMLVGYAYLGTTIPAEWPEKRTNKLTNGGFEDLSVIQVLSEDLYRHLTAADNYGDVFTASIHPNTPNWVYEVPSGFSYENTGGLWGTGYYGSPLPTPGMHDVVMYMNNDLKVGQVVGPLTSGATYYLDSACGVFVDGYGSAGNWPSPAPILHIELWRIPAGVSDGTVIYNAIASSNPNYVKVAEAAVSSTGNIKGSVGYYASKWQIIGTSYTATSLDTNMYVRIYGSGGYYSTPEYAFSDVYLSTQKRDVPGGATTFDLSSGLQYNVIGPYDCYHAGVMGVATMLNEDLNGDCIVNMADYATIAENWVKDWYTNITGTTPWN